MINAEEVLRQKEQIVALIQTRGPMLPVQIAKSINNSTIFTSAFLSELVGDKRIKTSSLRVGSSCLYLLAGQEPMLENFIQYLNTREKEAFHIIKEKGILEDSAQTPVIRVAIRAIPDFAIQFETQEGEAKKIFWRYFLISEEEARNKIQKVKPEEKPIIQENKLPNHQEEVKLPDSQEESASPEEFLKKVEYKLKEKGIELTISLTNKKKEFAGQAKTSSAFGEQIFYILAKDKKKLSEKDFSSAVQKAYSEKMPLIFLSQGIPDKKAAVYLSQWRNFLKFEQLKP